MKIRLSIRYIERWKRKWFECSIQISLRHSLKLCDSENEFNQVKVSLKD